MFFAPALTLTWRADAVKNGLVAPFFQIPPAPPFLQKQKAIFAALNPSRLLLFSAFLSDPHEYARGSLSAAFGLRGVCRLPLVTLPCKCAGMITIRG